LTQYASWRWCKFHPLDNQTYDLTAPGFYINLPIGGLASLALLKANIPSHQEKSDLESESAPQSLLSKLDPIGFCLFAPFAIMLLLALQWGGKTYAWSSATVIGLFCGAGGTLILFLAWEYRIADKAMVPISILSKRVVWCSCLFIGFFFGSFLVSSYYLPIYFQAVKGVSPALSAVYTLPSILSSMFTGMAAGLLGECFVSTSTSKHFLICTVSKLGWYIPWSVASAILSPVAFGLISTFTPHTTTVEWIMFQIIGGIGRGCGMQMVRPCWSAVRIFLQELTFQ
jgi:hypothetical protein